MQQRRHELRLEHPFRAALLAARHATERNGAVVPELATLSHGFFMHLRLADMSTNAPTAIEAYRSVETADVDGIVDGASSAVNVHLAQLGALDALPQLSYYSSSPGLSSATYSHFGRTYISDHISAKVLTREISTFKWQYMGVLHLRDPWASTYADYLAAAAASARRCTSSGGAPSWPHRTPSAARRQQRTCEMDRRNPGE